MKKIEDIDQKLKVGPSCIHMNISAIYESLEALYLSLGYTNTDFIYNKESFTKFLNPKNPEEYISKDNDLIIAMGIDSEYLNDTDLYLELFSKEIYTPIIESLDVGSGIDLHDFKVNYLDKGLPIMYVCDHYYTYEDYKKNSNEIMHFHTSGHMAVLYDIDFENRTVDVIDKFYRFKGKVNLENFEKSINSKHLDCNKFETVKIENHNIIPERDGFSEFLKQNFIMTIKDEITIEQRTYHKNKEALKKFASDFNENVESLYIQKGKYAPQFLSKLITPTILQKISFKNILEYIIEFDENPDYKDLLQLTLNSTKLWTRIDQYNDKCYLEGKTILEKMDKYNKLLGEILENDLKIYQLLARILPLQAFISRETSD